MSDPTADDWKQCAEEFAGKAENCTRNAQTYTAWAEGADAKRAKDYTKTAEEWAKQGEMYRKIDEFCNRQASEAESGGRK
ncbi:hypothetical protein KRX56_06145 [Dermabacteraceae bacterium TAE3-ERU27]|nr:hypothetical protein [Dermabacteraceae bacterium TAE3-ERU27]